MLAAVAAFAAIALSGCLQDAEHADSNFNFDNPLDPSATTTNSVQIIEIDTALGVVTIFNGTSVSQDMTNWTLVDNGTTFTFPNAFAVASASFVRIHSAAGSDSSIDLFSSGFNWGSAGGTTATLINGSGTQISTCVVGQQTC